MRATILIPWIGALVAACSSANTDGTAAGGESVCALGARTCPAQFTHAPPGLVQECAPPIACQVQCMIDNGCVFDQRYGACASRCTSSGVDAGTSDTSCVGGHCIACHTSSDCPAFAPVCSDGLCVEAGVADGGTDTGASGDDTGSGGGDTSTGGGAGCTTVYDDYSCTCVAGTADDGKGCSPHSLAAPAGCCASSGRCTCDAVTCTSSGSGCICMLGGYASTETSCSGALCCAFEATSDVPGNCQCYDKPGTGGCAALGGTTVSSCTASDTPCYYPEDHSTSSCE